MKSSHPASGSASRAATSRATSRAAAPPHASSHVGKPAENPPESRNEGNTDRVRASLNPPTSALPGSASVLEPLRLTKPFVPIQLRTLQIGMHWFPEQPGGLDRIFMSLIEQLPGVGVGVRGIVSGSDKVAMQSQGMIAAFAASKTPLTTRLMAARRAIRTLIAEQRPDLVASHFALYALPAIGAIGAEKNRARVTHFHGPWADEASIEGAGTLNNVFKRTIELLVYARQTRYIVLSRAFARVLESRYRVPADKIRVIPGCVDVDAFALPVTRDGARAQLGLPTDRPIVLSVRRLARRMGLENLIDAMPAIVAKVPDALLVIVGRGALAEELAARIAAKSLEHHVRLLGGVSDALLPLTYRAADLSVVPTISHEGFGLTTIESLASGTPVMVTPVGGLPETVENLSEDLIFQDASISTLADGITAALRGSTVLPTEAQCRDYARAGFNAPLMARRTAEIYHEALQGRDA